MSSYSIEYLAWQLTGGKLYCLVQQRVPGILKIQNHMKSVLNEQVPVFLHVEMERKQINCDESGVPFKLKQTCLCLSTSDIPAHISCQKNCTFRKIGKMAVRWSGNFPLKGQATEIIAACHLSIPKDFGHSPQVGR